mmetsp:Transcript_2356/g.3622  ORF Transcript_2356/g.3622 Transcript_2356/m.3622 type:complete len:308 (-) Transcript_2356:59-982(-)
MTISGKSSTANPIPSPGRIRHNGGSRNFGTVLFVVLFSIGVIHSINRSLNGYNKYFKTLSSPYQKPVKNADLVTGNVMQDMSSVDPRGNISKEQQDGTDVSNSVENNSAEDTVKEDKDGTEEKTDEDTSLPAETEEKDKVAEEKTDVEQSNNVEEETKQEGGEDDNADKTSEETVDGNAKKDAAATSDPSDQEVPDAVGSNATIVDGETPLAGRESVTEDSAVTTASQTAEGTDPKTDVPDTVTEKEDSPAAGEEGTGSEQATTDEATVEFRAKKDIPEADGNDSSPQDQVEADVNEEIKEEVAEDE